MQHVPRHREAGDAMNVTATTRLTAAECLARLAECYETRKTSDMMCLRASEQSARAGDAAGVVLALVVAMV